MKNIRRKINQLRVAYFMPTKPISFSTGAEYSANPICVDIDTALFGSYQYHTPCVGYVSNIPNITYLSGSVVQTVPVCNLESPFAPSSRAFCTPRRIPVVPLSDGHRFRVLDYTNYVRAGYRFHLHQAASLNSMWIPQFPQASYLNLYF